VFYSLLYIRRHGYNHIDTLLRTHIRDVATLLLADGHPWRQLFSQLADIEESQFEFTLIEAYKCICDTFANSLGQFHRTTLFSYTGFLDIEKSSNVPQLLHDLLIRGEQEFGKFDARIVNIKCSYGYSLYNHGQYAEAIEVLEEVVICCKELGRHEYLVADSLDLIAWGGHFLGRHEENDEFRVREAIGRLEEIVGKFHACVLYIKTRLEKRLREMGRVAEAAEVRAEMNEALGLDEIELESN
jgi:hypothetical protein